MAEFAAISASILTDDEFLALSADFKHVWLTLVISPLGGRCGIFKGGILVLSQQTTRDVELVCSALESFINLGWIIRDGEYLWIRSRIKHRAWNANWKTGALNEARSLLASTPLARRCLEYYGVASLPDASRSDETQPDASGRKSNPLDNSIQHKQSKANSKAPADAGTSVKAEVKPRTPRAAKPAQPHESADPGYTPDELALAERMDADVAKLKEQGFNIGKNWRRRPEQMAASLHASGVNTSDAGKAWDWGIAQQFWTSRLVNQASFQTQPNGWVELVNQWRARTQGVTQALPSMAAEEMQRSIEDVLTPQPVAVSAAFAEANGIPTLGEINIDDLPTPEAP